MGKQQKFLFHSDKNSQGVNMVYLDCDRLQTRKQSFPKNLRDEPAENLWGNFVYQAIGIRNTTALRQRSHRHLPGLLLLRNKAIDRIEWMKINENSSCAERMHAPITCSNAGLCSTKTEIRN